MNVERTTKTVNYGKRDGFTNVDVWGTTLLPVAEARQKSKGSKVTFRSKRSSAACKVLPSFGPEYLTYVIWGITPEGCFTNLGEVVPNDRKSKLNVTFELDVFGLIVTAEPYFAVSQPSDVVVMENIFRKDSVRTIEEVDAKYQLLPRGSYTANVSRSELKPIAVDPNTPLDLYEDSNAFWIALWAGAEKDAAELFAKAERSLQKAEALPRKQGWSGRGFDGCARNCTNCRKRASDRSQALVRKSRHSAESNPV